MSREIVNLNTYTTHSKNGTKLIVQILIPSKIFILRIFKTTKNKHINCEFFFLLDRMIDSVLTYSLLRWKTQDLDSTGLVWWFV